MYFEDKHCYKNMVKDSKVLAKKSVEYTLCSAKFNLPMLTSLLTDFSKI